MPEPTRAMRLGVAGPVGTGKSSLIGTLCRALSGELRLGVVTNDIYTQEDAMHVRRELDGVISPDSPMTSAPSALAASRIFWAGTITPRSTTS